MKKTIFLIVPFILFAKAVKVEDILTQANKVKLETSIMYTNIQKKEILLAPITYQTANGDFINIPTYVGDTKTNQDYINYGLSFKYGFNRDLEIFINTNFYTNIIHQSSIEHSLKTESGFGKLVAGLIYQIKEEDNSPSLLVGTNLDVLQSVIFANDIQKNQSFKGYSFFLTSFFTVDPIVFYLKTDIRINKEQLYKGKTIKNGNVFVISPKVYFAVNPFTSLNWGIRYRYKGKDFINGKEVSGSGSSIGYDFGVSYEINHKLTFNCDIEKLDTNEYISNNINLSFVYEY